MTNHKSVAVIIPAYGSERTIAGCLSALRRQTFRSFAVTVVDSSPDGRTADIVAEAIPEVKLIRSGQRLLPHAARNLGAESSDADLLVFTDPDIYPRPDWLEQLLEAHSQFSGIVVGAVACHNPDWLRRAFHMVKFDSWLPGGRATSAEIIMTGSLLVERETFLRLGMFDGRRMLADTLFDWCADRHGLDKTFTPAAVVDHDHRQDLAEFLSERFQRGVEFGRLRIGWEGWSSWRVALQFLITALPLRLVNLALRCLRNGHRANMLPRAILALPIIFLGQGSWLLGELAAYVSHITGAKAETDLHCGS